MNPAVGKLPLTPLNKARVREERLAKTLSAIYDPPSPDMPKIAVIFQGGQLTFAQAVTDQSEGKVLLRDMLAILEPPPPSRTDKSRRR